MRTFPLLRAEHLSAEPQLASLALLDAACHVVILALGAEYPELAESDIELHRPPDLRAAVDLIELARAVDVAILRYRRALAERHERERREDELLAF